MQTQTEVCPQDVQLVNWLRGKERASKLKAKDTGFAQGLEQVDPVLHTSSGQQLVALLIPSIQLLELSTEGSLKCKCLGQAEQRAQKVAHNLYCADGREQDVHDICPSADVSDHCRSGLPILSRSFQGAPRKTIAHSVRRKANS